MNLLKRHNHSKVQLSKEKKKSMKEWKNRSDKVNYLISRQYSLKSRNTKETRLYVWLLKEASSAKKLIVYLKKKGTRYKKMRWKYLLKVVLTVVLSWNLCLQFQGNSLLEIMCALLSILSRSIYRQINRRTGC
jgi:hypothetical protein